MNAAAPWLGFAGAADEVARPLLKDLREAADAKWTSPAGLSYAVVAIDDAQTDEVPPCPDVDWLVFVGEDVRLDEGALGRLLTAAQQETNARVLSLCGPPLFDLPRGLTVDADVAAGSALRRRPPLPWPVLGCLVPRALVATLDAWRLFAERPFGEALRELGRRAWQAEAGVYLCEEAWATGTPAQLTGPAWAEFRRLYPLRVMALRLLTAGWRRPRPRVLHVIHNFGGLGGTELYTRAIVDGLRGQVDSAVLFPNDLAEDYSDRDAVVTIEAGGLVRIEMSRALAPTEHIVRGAPLELRGAMTERFFGEVLAGVGANIVHVQHLATLGSFLLPIIARRLGARVVITLHDYYLLCADWNLIGPTGTACGKARLEDDQMCRGCLAGKRQARDPRVPFAWGPWIAERHELTRAALAAADVLVAPSSFVQTQFARAYGDELARKIRVIPHGIEPAAPSPARRSVRTRLRVAFLGHLLPEKGRAVFLEAVRRLRGAPIDFVVLGGAQEGADLAGLTNLARPGPFQPADLPRRLADVDVVVLASVWHETYGYTLDEAYRAGVPVVAARVGAFGERVRPDETGLLFEAGDAVGLTAALQRLIDEPALRVRLREGVAAVQLKSRDENVREYGALYGELLRAQDEGGP